MLLRMLLGCGFRLGEPLAAKVKDINFQSGTILIRHAKNNKQRVIPMDVTLTQMLERYCIAMGIKTEPESYLFPSSKNKGAAVSKGTFDLRFRNLLQDSQFFCVFPLGQSLGVAGPVKRQEHKRELGDNL